MFRIFLVILALILISKITSANNLSDELIFSLENCDINRSNYKFTVNLDKNKIEVKANHREGGSTNYTVSINKNKSSTQSIVSHLFTATNEMHPKRDYTKTQKLAFANVKASIKIIPKKEKVTFTFNSISTSDRKIIKAFIKTFGQDKIVNESWTTNCSNIN